MTTPTTPVETVSRWAEALKDAGLTSPDGTFVHGPTSKVVDTLAALVKAGRERAWQPIETAPKDGHKLFIGVGARLICAYWDEGEECFCEAQWGAEIKVGPDTKWHPYLAPPAALPSNEQVR